MPSCEGTSKVRLPYQKTFCPLVSRDLRVADFLHGFMQKVSYSQINFVSIFLNCKLCLLALILQIDVLDLKNTRPTNADTDLIITILDRLF